MKCTKEKINKRLHEHFRHCLRRQVLESQLRETQAQLAYQREALAKSVPTNHLVAHYGPARPAKGGHSDSTAQAVIQHQRNAQVYQECIARLEEEEAQLLEEIAAVRRQTMALSVYLELLPSDEQELIDHRYRAGESTRHIALAQLCDESTIRYRLQRILGVLAGWLG